MIVDGYVRVSQTRGRSGASFISPQVQRDQVVGWIASQGLVLGEVFEELDESGARADRPLLMRAIARVEAGESQGLVVAKLDRFGRSMIDALAAVERIQKAGGTFVSVADGLDLRTDTGRLVLRMMLSLAEWELDRIRSSWDVARERAVARGMHLSATAPFGYRRGPDGCLEPDPLTAQYLAGMFERRGAGFSLHELSVWLREEGVRTALGNPGWSGTTVRGILANRVYLGEARCGEHVNLTAHPALVDPTTWLRAQQPANTFPPRRTQQPTLLGGLARCAGCRLVMSSGSIRDRGSTFVVYTCGREHGGGPCPAPTSISAARLEPFVEAQVRQAMRAAQRPLNTGLARAEREYDSAEGELASYRDDARVLGALGSDRYAAGLVRRRAKLDHAQAELAAAHERGRKVGPDLRALEARWEELSLLERRAAITALVDCVFVAKGRVPVAKKTFVCWRGEAPLDIPRRGGRHVAVQSFHPRDCPAPAARRRAVPIAFDPWPVEEVATQLSAFLGARSVWPAREQFERAGRAELYDQLGLHGGPKNWATSLGLPTTFRPRVPAWSEELLQSELEAYLHGRSEWPTLLEFTRDGRGKLWKAASARGGIDAWAERFGLARHERAAPAGARYWTPERIEIALRGFLAGRDRYPSATEFAAHGLGGLYNAIKAGEGHRERARRAGFSLEEHRWTDERPRAELGVFLAGRTTWPLSREFTQAGATRLRDAVQRRGGTEHWAEQFGLPRASRRRGSRAYWTEQRVRDTLVTLKGELGRYPSEKELHAKGFGGMYEAMVRLGGRSRWRREYAG